MHHYYSVRVKYFQSKKNVVAEYKTLHYGRRRRRHAGSVLVLSLGCDMSSRASGVVTNIPNHSHSATWRLKLAYRPSRHAPPIKKSSRVGKDLGFGIIWGGAN